MVTSTRSWAGTTSSRSPPVLADPPHLLAATWAMAVGEVQHLLDPLQVRRQLAAVAAPLGMRLAAARGWVVVARRRWSGWRRRESQGQLPGVDALGALAEAGPAQVVDDLLQRRDARLSRGERGAQLALRRRLASPLLLTRSSGTPELSPTCPRRAKRKQHAAASRCRRSPLPLRGPPFQALQQQGRLRGRQRDGSGRCHGPGEVPVLEPSHEKAEARRHHARAP